MDSTNYSFTFDVENYKLGNQTEKTLVSDLANSDKGQHIHFITNNEPYSAHYEGKFEKYIEENNSIILAFLSRSYHESVKNKNAYVLMQTGEKYNLDKEYIFYSRPKSNYSGSASEKILLDFYLVNTEISKEGNRVRVTINDQEFMIYKWAPYYIEGLQKGEATIKITSKDLLKFHKLKKSEIDEFMNDIKEINDYLQDNPKDLLYVQERYPKDDPRLAELNWKMDQKLGASKEYMDKHFPENQKLYKKLIDNVKKNIELTGHKKAPKFEKKNFKTFRENAKRR